MITNPDRQIGPHPNVTIRHARHAFNLLVCGAMREIEAGSDVPEVRQKFEHELLVQLREEMAGWESAA